MTSSGDSDSPSHPWVTERFTEHDLPAKCASEAETLVHAQQLLARADSATTQRIYRRRPERVKPLIRATFGRPN